MRGAQALVRLRGIKNFDIGVAKSFPMPCESIVNLANKLKDWP